MSIIINFRADTSSVVKALQEVEGQVAAFSNQSSQAVASGIVLAGLCFPRARNGRRKTRRPLGTRAGGLLRPCGNTRQTPLDGALIKPIMITVCADPDDDGDADG